MKVFFKIYDSKMASREKLFKAATEFANKIGQDRLINITHSEDRDNIVIAVWYWGEEEIKDERQGRKMGERPAVRPAGDAGPGSSLEKSGAARELEKSGTARELEKSGAAPDLARAMDEAAQLEAGHTMPTPLQDLIIPPPSHPRPPVDPLEDSW